MAEQVEIAHARRVRASAVRADGGLLRRRVPISLVEREAGQALWRAELELPVRVGDLALTVA